MNEELVKDAVKLFKLLEHFSKLNKVHVYIQNDFWSLAYRIYAMYNEFRGREKTFCIDAKHYIEHKKKYSNKASYNICFTCEFATTNTIIIDKSEIFSKHLIKVIFKINHSENMSESEEFKNTKEWYFIEDNILQRKFEELKRKQ